MTPPLMAESEEKLKSLLIKVKEESEKGLKAQHPENAQYYYCDYCSYHYPHIRICTP